MTEVLHAVACACGQPITKVFSSGRPGKNCNQCMDRQAGRAKGAWRRGDIACTGCRTPFTPKAAHQKFCSDQCKYRERDRRESTTGLVRADYLAKVMAAAKIKHGFKCVHCGAATVRRVSGTNSTAGYINKFCSLDCRDVVRAATALDARLRAGPHSRCFGLYCQLCLRPFVARHLKTVCSAACDAKASGRAAHARAGRSVRCEDCETEFCPTYGHSHAALCHPCSRSRARAHQLISKTVRRARLRAATVELVDPLLVFERDGWACQLCGIPTPRSKRGGYDDDAPELDHIIALAVGGEHSYRNTQCLCRRCNSLKSDRPMEEVSVRLQEGRAS